MNVVVRHTYGRSPNLSTINWDTVQAGNSLGFKFLHLKSKEA